MVPDVKQIGAKLILGSNPLRKVEGEFFFIFCLHPIIYIIRLTLNTEFDTVCLFGWHAQMTHFGVYPLVCPCIIWPGQGFYVEPFLIDAFPSEYKSKWKRVFSKVSSEKK